MSGFADTNGKQGEQFGSGMGGAVVLHVVVAAALIGFGVLYKPQRKNWGEQISTVGAIQASMVNALPLPPKAPPVEHQVLASDDTSPAPTPPPKEAAAPPPKPTDVLIKAPTPPKQPAKTAPMPTPEPPKHPQPTPPTPKADYGSSATQLPQSVSPLKNGTSAITVEDRTFGARYAYYIRGMERSVTQSYYQQDIDARSAQDRSVSLVFDIQQDGTITNIKFVSRSGSASLDMAAMRALQRIDSFGPLPAGDHITVQYTFGYHLP